MKSPKVCSQKIPFLSFLLSSSALRGALSKLPNLRRRGQAVESFGRRQEMRLSRIEEIESLKEYIYI